MKRAVIVGSRGQDGRLLSELLTRQGCLVEGVDRGGPVDVTKLAHVKRLLSRFRPDEIYYLAAFHHSSQENPRASEDFLRRTWETNTLGLAHFLEAMSLGRRRARLFYAASSRVFGEVRKGIADEKTPIAPADVYGAAKAAGLHLCRLYRLRGVFASAGILFNHESPLRDPKFVSRKIARAAVAIKHGRQKTLALESLDARADWGYAPDFVEAMTAIVRLRRADDFVVATGKTHRVRDLVRLAFSQVGLDWRRHVEAGGGLKGARGFAGDASKLRRAAGWKPRTSFERMIELMVESEERAWAGR